MGPSRNPRSPDSSFAAKWRSSLRRDTIPATLGERSHDAAVRIDPTGLGGRVRLRAARSQAHEWLKQELDAARLLGASLLLDDATNGDSAAQELQVLQRSTDDRVRSLAQAQSWRLKLRALEVGDLELNRWETRIHDMPASLRGGPSYLLGRGRTMRREHDRAATALLWTSLMDDGDARLAARAGVEAAQSLKRLGQSDDARRLLQEIARRFPDTEFGEAAK